MRRIINQIEQYKKLDKLIMQARTGTPDELAVRLKISRSHLYMLLDSMKSFGAPIKYKRYYQSFYYDEDFKLEIDVKMRTISHNECKTIYGGIQNSTPVLFTGRSKLSLAGQTLY